MVILLYHNIVKTDYPKSIYSTDEEAFKEQIQYLKENNYQVLSLGSLVGMLNYSKDIPQESAVITFDDGLSEHFEFAYPFLKELGISACFFIIADRVGKDGHMNWDQIKTLALNDMEIGSHGLTHQPFDLQTKLDILNELKKSKEILEENLNREIGFFSLPRDSLKEKMVGDLTKIAGYKALCLSKVGYISSSSGVFSLPRFPIRRSDTLYDFIKILKNNPSKFFSYRIKELSRDCLKRSLGMVNYERLRRKLLKKEYSNERPSPE